MSTRMSMCRHTSHHITSRLDGTDGALALAGDEHIGTFGHALQQASPGRSAVAAETIIGHTDSSLPKQCQYMLGMAAHLVAIRHQVICADWIICVGCVFTVARCTRVQAYCQQTYAACSTSRAKGMKSAEFCYLCSLTPCSSSCTA